MMRSEHRHPSTGLFLVLFLICMVLPRPVCGNADAPSDLHALSAVLMDGDSGRVLFSKEGDVSRPMASTTKVMTCILALENGAGDDYVQVSANAAMQPEVRLGMRVDEQYYLEDLLYSLMLKSHNDTAVAIAEHIGGSVEGFARLMNQKAKEIGCTDTYFITPNGLDSRDDTGEHHTTARDLCLIMRYAIRNKNYLALTAAKTHTFHDIAGRRTFTVENANALLNMTDDALTGKTGYTANAGYCYVCACRPDDRTFIIALLGCGWPAHRNWKWQDTLELLNYAEENFQYRNYPQTLPPLPKLKVERGADAKGGLWSTAMTTLQYGLPEDYETKTLLLKTTDTLTLHLDLPETVEAPVKKQEKLGNLVLCLNGEPMEAYPVLSAAEVPKFSYTWVLSEIAEMYFH